MENIFNSILDTTQETIEPATFLICIAVSLLIGAFLALVYKYKTKYSNSFLITLALLPAIVGTVIMAVNGSIGAGIAVAGAFSLVRFRSIPGSAKEIAAIFIAMCAGLVTGMGYLAYAVLFALIIGIILLLFNHATYKAEQAGTKEKVLKITIPEDLNYEHAFDDLFEKYTQKSEITSIKTTNMGSLYKLAYNIKLKTDVSEKEFVDELRCRNGNLEIIISMQESNYAL